MFAERRELTEGLQSLIASACVELMQAYGLALTETTEEWAESEELLLSGVMGFVGEKLRGTCLLAATESAIKRAAPADARPRDWVGELANQLVGRLKTKLMARGLIIALTTPVVLKGVKLAPLPRTDSRPALFDSPAGRVLVWLEVEASSDLTLGSEHPLRASEGELLVF